MDTKFIGTSTAVFLALLVVCLVAARLGGLDLPRALTRREWNAAAKLGVVIVLGFVLLVQMIIADLPADIFIYGRF